MSKKELKVVTHPGRIHRDEFYAIALLSVMEDAVVLVERRNPTIVELEDRNTYVVDVGLSHCEELNNYDHHQWRGGDNAFTLLLKKYKVQNKKVLALGEASRVLDTEGYYTFINKYPAGFTFSELETTILRELQEEKISWEEGIKFMKIFFKYELIIRPAQLKRRAELLDNNYSYNNGILTITTPLRDSDGLDTAFGIYEWTVKNNIKEDIQIGWGIDRDTNENIVTIYLTKKGQDKGYNVNNIVCEHITYRHASGFLATTKTQDIDTILKDVLKYIKGIRS